LAAIFFASESQFGERVADRYRRLVGAALRDVGANPTRQGVKVAPGAAGALRVYHLRHSRRLGSGALVSRPRHLLVFVETEDEIVIERVLHDAMDLPSRLMDL